MKRLLKNIIVFPFIFLLFFSLESCVSYYQMSLKYQTKLEEGNYEEAYKFVKKNRFLKKKRNKVLHLMEQGRIAFLLNKPEESNKFFHSVDSILEENRKHIGNKIIGNFTNPERETYKAEDFEAVAIHYYKAMNYIKLHNYEAALVETRRINLRLQAINDKYPPKKKNRYKTDAFALNLQGLIYEASGDLNNAFIAYRNAVNLYLENTQLEYFGTTLPQQLVFDLLSSAYRLGFTNEVSRYEYLLQQKFNPLMIPQNGEAIIFWEKGLVPFKNQDYISFTNTGISNGNMHLSNTQYGLNFDVPTSNDASRLSFINIAFANYVQREPVLNNVIVKVNKKKYFFEEVENYDAIAIKVLEDKRAREIGKAVMRLATKKLAEELLAKENANAGTALSLVNALTEKADTRNWQSLPSSIQYSRIPLKRKKTTINVEFSNDLGKSRVESIILDETKNGIYFYHFSTI
jgi:hypothetical protein